jgi:predicted MFS family arabinose efflux permease
MNKHTTLEFFLLIGLCLSGAAALIYEVVWMRALSLVMGSTTYALSTMLAAFMAGLTLGGYLGGLWSDRTRNPAQSFGFLEAGIALFGLITFVVIKNLSPVYAWIFYTFHLSFSSFSIAQFVLSFMVMLICFKSKGKEP